jgi:hypothetical protein
MAAFSLPFRSVQDCNSSGSMAILLAIRRALMSRGQPPPEPGLAMKRVKLPNVKVCGIKQSPTWMLLLGGPIMRACAFGSSAHAASERHAPPCNHVNRDKEECHEQELVCICISHIDTVRMCRIGYGPTIRHCG